VVFDRYQDRAIPLFLDKPNESFLPGVIEVQSFRVAGDEFQSGQVADWLLTLPRPVGLTHPEGLSDSSPRLPLKYRQLFVIGNPTQIASILWSFLLRQIWFRLFPIAQAD